MNGLTHRWTIQGTPAPDAGASPAGAPGIPALVTKVLAARGITDPDTVSAFCRPTLRQMHDPSLMPGLDRAAERVLEALRRAEPVVIYGDYDVDGLCASAILFHTLRALAPGGAVPAVSTYVPHRLDEGYGLHPEAVDDLAGKGAKLIVTVDCGVTAFEAAGVASRRGAELIITDHHALPPPERGLPDCFAVVHPRVADDAGLTYPFGELCGAGVAFKLAWRIATLACGSDKLPDPVRDLLLELLALAGLGTIADVVPLEGENRVIARFGLDQLKRSRLTGIRALIDAAGLAGEEIDSERAGFALAPRLNACGRMAHAQAAMEMLTVAPPDRAAAVARELNSLNAERQKTEKAIFEQACEMAQQAGMTRPESRAIVLAHPDWHAGVVGIVCSRLIARFHRPTILLARGAETSHGSGRSIDGFNLHAGLSACADLLEKFGGHDMAAGMVVRNDRLDEFARRFSEAAGDLITPEMLTPRLRVDCEAGLGELTHDAVRALMALGPFGRGNPRPCLVVRGAKPMMDAAPMGANGAHLNVRLSHQGRTIRLVGWRWGDRLQHFRAGRAVDVAIHPRINVFNGAESVEGELCDVAAA